MPLTTIEELPLRDMVPCHGNRPIKPHWVKKLVKSWRDELCETITVNRRSCGTVAVIDGQHRRLAALEVKGLDVRWRCVVHHGLSLEQEAEMFKELNVSRMPATVAERFHAALLAKEKQAIEVDAIVRANGFRLRTVDRGLERKCGYIIAVGAVLKIHERYETGTLNKVLSLIAGEYGTKVGPSAEVMLAMAAFLSRYRDSVDRARLSLTLQRMSMARWEAEAADFKRVMGGGTDTAAAFVLVKQYNDGLRGRRLPGWNEAA